MLDEKGVDVRIRVERADRGNDIGLARILGQVDMGRRPSELSRACVIFMPT